MSASGDSSAPTQARPAPLPPVGEIPPGAPAGAPSAPKDLVEQDLLVEDVSIDGMCGVY